MFILAILLVIWLIYLWKKDPEHNYYIKLMSKKAVDWTKKNIDKKDYSAIYRPNKDRYIIIVTFQRSIEIEKAMREKGLNNEDFWIY